MLNERWTLKLCQEIIHMKISIRVIVSFLQMHCVYYFNAEAIRNKIELRALQSCTVHSTHNQIQLSFDVSRWTRFHHLFESVCKASTPNSEYVTNTNQWNESVDMFNSEHWTLFSVQSVYKLKFSSFFFYLNTVHSSHFTLSCVQSIHIVRCVRPIPLYLPLIFI